METGMGGVRERKKVVRLEIELEGRTGKIHVLLSHQDSIYIFPFHASHSTSRYYTIATISHPSSAYFIKISIFVYILRAYECFLTDHLV
jgi:hypothetical protein